MLNQQKVELSDLLRRYKIPLEITTVEEIKPTKTSIGCFEIWINETKLRFKILCSKDSFDNFAYNYSVLKPGFPVAETVGSPGYTESFFQVKNAFDNWLYKVVVPFIRDLDTPDPWRNLKQFSQIIPSSNILPNDLDKFTPEEKEQISISIDEFYLLLEKNLELTQEQSEFIIERLDYLKEAVDRLNRFDWKGLAVSVVVGIGINLSVDTQTGQEILKWFTQAFTMARFLLK